MVRGYTILLSLGHANTITTKYEFLESFGNRHRTVTDVRFEEIKNMVHSYGCSTFRALMEVELPAHENHHAA
jgi:hypothetical protein